MKIVDIYTNSLGSGDWIVIKFEDEVVFQGHNLGARSLRDILNTVNGYDGVEIHDLTDSSIECL